MHYKDFKGPTRSNNVVVPCYFKRPHEFYGQKTPERRVLIRDPTVEQVDDGGSCSSVDGSVEQFVCDVSTQCDDTLATENSTLKIELARMTLEIQRLRESLQKLDPSILSNSQISMYTGLNQEEFKILVSWLTATSIGRRSLSYILSFSQKFLMVLMRIKQNLTQGGLPVLC